MSAERLSPAFAEFDESSELELDQVLALQALVMGHVRRVAIQYGRKIHVRDNPRTHAYCMLQNSGDNIFSGEKDQYLGVRVLRLGYRAWGMGISFLENEMTPEQYASNLRVRYQFRWNDSEARGRRVEDLTMGPDYFEAPSPEGDGILMHADTYHVQLVMPLSVEEMGQVTNRTLEAVTGVTPRMERFLDRYVPAES